ncbi:MAG: hypothetical protein PSU94_10910 [Lacunisphaera sp.]|nr:hypothetical protein [Lacunisphaera sp.]
MATIGIELCNAGFEAAVCEKDEPRLLARGEKDGLSDWPGFAYHNGQKFLFGRPAEDVWFVHPRQICHDFWDKLSHEPSALNAEGKAPSFSELAFYFLRDFSRQLTAAAGAPDKLVLAVPSFYLKDAATEEQKVGLLLGMAGELGLPLAGVLDMASAALCDPRGPGINPNLPVVVIDIQLGGADISLHVAEGAQFVRRDFAHLAPAGYAPLLKHLTAAMGNRFLKHTAFDILEDGLIEQSFYRQTKDFIMSGAPEFRYQINTTRRAYEMTATHDQLGLDATSIAGMLQQGVQMLVHKMSEHTEPITVALTPRAASVPGLESRLRAAGFMRLLRLPAGAAACGAALVGATRWQVQDLADVPVETAVPLAEVKRSTGTPWEAHLHKVRTTGARPLPTHVIINGVGHVLGGNGGFTIGSTSAGPDLTLPESFNTAAECLVQLQREGGHLWFVEAGPAPAPNGSARPTRTVLEAGDRLVIRSGAASTDLLFAHCLPPARPPA